MSNMSYCRFRNTAADFQACLDALQDMHETQMKELVLSPDELKAAKRLAQKTILMMELFSDILGEDIGEIADEETVQTAIDNLQQSCEGHEIDHDEKEVDIPYSLDYNQYMLKESDHINNRNQEAFMKTEMIAQDKNVRDELNPHYILSVTETSLVRRIALGELDAQVLAAREMANRGLGKSGEWVGFDQAAKIWDVTN